MKRILYFLAIIIILPACVNQDNFDDVLNNANETVLSEEQNEMLAKMKETSLIITQFANNDEVNTELSMLISLNIYTDDFIPFKDLFSPKDNEVLKSANIIKTSFETAFDNFNNNFGLKSVDIENLKEYLVSNNMVLYIPYPLEDYPEDMRMPAISYHPLINDERNEGFLPIIQGGKMETYDIVQVDEEYSLTRPVYLIIPQNDYQLKKVSEISCSFPSNEVLKSAASYPVNPDHKFITITAEEIRSNDGKQYDGIFTTVNEFRVIKIGLNKINDHRYELDDDWVDCRLTRAQTRKMEWKPLGTVLMSDWTKEQVSIVLAAYEFDKGEWEVDNARASFYYKLDNAANVLVDFTVDESIRIKDELATQQGYDLGIGFKFEIQSKDEMFGKQTWGRNWIGTWPNGEYTYAFGSLSLKLKAVSYN